MELATAKDAIIVSLDTDMFKISETSNQQEKITRTIGTTNSSNISGNTLTVSSISYTFKQITVGGG